MSRQYTISGVKVAFPFTAYPCQMAMMAKASALTAPAGVVSLLDWKYRAYPPKFGATRPGGLNVRKNILGFRRNVYARSQIPNISSHQHYQAFGVGIHKIRTLVELN